MITSIYIGKDKLDLFEDENIQLKSSIAEIQDISKVFTDTTNSFNVPATDLNNRLFRHFYNSKIVNGWDLSSKVKCVIELDGVFYKELRLKLNGVVLKSNLPTYYKIQLFGNLTSLKDLFTDDKLSDLDFSSYNFTINSSNFLSNFSGFDLDIVATGLSKKRLLYDSNPDTRNTENTLNIADNGTHLNSGLNWFDLSHSIKCIEIIKKIESTYGIAFSKNYFNKPEFSKLYLLLNGSELEFEEQIVFDSSNDATLENDRVLLSTNFPSITSSIYIEVDNQGAFEQDEFTFIIKSNGNEVYSKKTKGNSNGDFNVTLDSSDIPLENLTFFYKSKTPLNYQIIIYRKIPNVRVSKKSQKNFSQLAGVFDVSNFMPDIKVLDFISGIFKKNKLIAYNTSENEIQVDTIVNYYRTGKVKNIDRYVDYKEIPIDSSKLVSRIDYSFKEPKTILQKEFYNNNGIYYGNLEHEILNDSNNKIEGKTEKVDLPFENMIYERLTDVSGNDLVEFQYGLMTDSNLNEVTVDSHLHYVVNLDTVNRPIKILTGGNNYFIETIYNIPTHTLGLSVPQFSTVFGEEFNEFNGVKITNTLFSNYHKEYINNAFYPNKRIYKIKCKNLPLPFLINLKLNDVIELKEDYYRINKYNLNLTTKEADLELYTIKDLNLTPEISITTDNIDYTADTTIITTDNYS